MPPSLSAAAVARAPGENYGRHSLTRACNTLTYYTDQIPHTCATGEDFPLVDLPAFPARRSLLFITNYLTP
eukprot:scaffold134637_cov24-Prasinocladus_malaysianus.AAC.2